MTTPFNEVKHFLNRIISKIKYEAKHRRHLDFDIDTNYILQIYSMQDGRCALSGRQLEFTRGGQFSNNTNARVATIDRIDSNQGYVKGNVQLLCWEMNKLKSDNTDQYLISAADDISNYTREKAIRAVIIEKTNTPFDALFD